MQIALKNYSKLLAEIQKLITQTQKNIVQTVNRQKVVMSWQIGREIDTHLKSDERAEYGKKMFEELEKDTAIAKSVLYQMRAFYKAYPTLPVAENDLSWSHYRNLAAIENDEKRQIFEELTVKNNLSSGDLQLAVADSKASEKKKIKPKTNTKLTRPQAQLFTYKIVEQLGFVGKKIDLGFSIFAEIKTKFKDGEIVESQKILLKKSAVTPAAMHCYKAILERVVDGDTLHVNLDLGFGITHKEILRLAKINAPEADTKEGVKSFLALKKILKDVPFLVVKTNKTDIYGRYVAEVFFGKKGEKDAQEVAKNGVYLNQLLLDLGVVEKY
jgi:endonuclease YncB( thermonuclease family)